MVDGTSLYLVLLLFPALLAFGGMMDLVTMTIPNKVSIALVITFVLAALASAMPLETFGVHVAVGFGIFVICLGLFAVNGIGGGDAKLIPAAALWIGFEYLFEYILGIVLLGGLLSLMLIGYRSMMPPLFLTRQPWAMRLHSTDTGIPYGIAIGGSGLLIFPATPWFSLAATSL
ncbi:MAG: prepilin peptidase [Pseudomonadota bacterium]